MRICDKLPQGVDAAIISDEKNRQYLTGVRSSAGTVVVTRDETYLIIDFRYIEMARQTAVDCQVLLQGRLYQQIGELFAAHGVKTWGLCDSLTDLAQLRRYQKQLPGAFLEDSGVDGLLQQLRMCKSEVELGFIRQAQQLTDDCFSYITQRIAAGRSERDIALDMEFYIRRQGAQGVSFDFIVVSGENSSKPHGVPGERLVQPGDFITMDFGCTVGGYCSDMTRTVAVGQVTDEQRQVYDIVLQANRLGVQLAGPGVACDWVDAQVRALIADAGYGECFGHGLGHGVGLDIHEEPAFSPSCGTLTRPGMVITVEPGIYLPGRFGVRIEDMVVITRDGCTDITRSPKELLAL
ncbi:Xaa-Pro peptidase family protein [Neobittarella massiliensis]|uniref:Aminopeptidase P family protein n=2 Tax=Oscillospiraceae TaxID=216572 RepID=A0A8J6LY88_9FIRM|nr:Xaa-Pro peptidase family protein [Neobittarella massiliensis]MBC3515343.1 aminopeptidase P family protein [Neobittarella massiliensis]SCJ59482.1 Uncharacterized peptidase SA1530 [uncultured Anaerotruncus sp.]